MYELKFDEQLCADCETVDCLTKCKFMDLDIDAAKAEMKKIIDGENSSVLRDCVTCYSCEEYCPYGNHPFYLKAERQEELNMSPVPRPNSLIMPRAFPPSEGYEAVGEAERVLDLCIFPMAAMLQGPLFEGLTILPTPPGGPEGGGHHFFCQLGNMHFGKASVVRDRLPRTIANLAKHNPKEVICFHDECYAAFTSYAPAYGMEVPFKPIHFYEYLVNRLQELKDRIKPLNMKVAYQRPCSSKLIPQMDHFVDDIFNLIGVERVKREYDREDALCCGSVIMVQKEEGRYEVAADLNKRNIDDMKGAGAQACVFTCPACFIRLGEPVMKSGLTPMIMFQLCQKAIG